MKVDDAYASSALANETLKSHHDENMASTSRISAETQTEEFDHLYLSWKQRLLHLLTNQIILQGF